LNSFRCIINSDILSYLMYIDYLIMEIHNIYLFLKNLQNFVKKLCQKIICVIIEEILCKNLN